MRQRGDCVKYSYSVPLASAGGGGNAEEPSYGFVGPVQPGDGDESPQDQNNEQGEDVYFKKDAKQTISIQYNTGLCGPTVLAHASSELGGAKNTVNDIWEYAFSISKVNISVSGMSAREMKTTTKYFFKTGKFTSYEDAINKGNPVVTWFPIDASKGINHFVLVIGYNSSTKELIYLNSLTGHTDRNTESFFDPTIRIPLIKNK